MSLRESEQPLLPDPIVEASLWANIRYPQSDTGLTLAVGHAVTTAILQGSSSWAELRSATFAHTQVNKLAEGMGRLHAVYDIPARVTKPDEPPQASVYVDRLSGLTRAAISTVEATTARFARSVLRAPVPGGLEIEELEEVEVRKPIVELFAKPTGSSTFRPEALALGELWQAGAECLTSGAAMKISVAYRNDLRTMYSPDTTRPQWQEAYNRVGEADDALRAVIETAVTTHVPAIQEGTGVELDESIAQNFISDTVAGITRPTMPQRLREG